MKSVPAALRRRALHVTAAGLTASMVCVATTLDGPVLPPPTVVSALAIQVVLTAAIGEAPTTLGVADSDLYRLSEAEIGATLDRLKGLGVNDIRVAVPWIYIQPRSSADYDWTKMDMVVRAAAEREMNIVGVLSGTPAWAGFPINGHSDPADYAAFAGAVADRYKDDTVGEIGHYEVWNEPNGALFYNPISATAYTEMLRAAYPAIKAADPDAVVIAGVLGSVATLPGLSLQPDTFVAQMYDNGAHGSFDALSFHPYHYTLPFSRGADVANSPVNQVAAIRALMTAHGDQAVKIWVTEYGLPTNPQISEAEQAAFIRDFVVTWQNVEGAGPIFVYSTRDLASGAFDDENNFGIFYTDWTPKQAAAAVQDLIEDLADGTAEPFDVTPYLPQNSLLDNLFIVARQIVSLLLIVPRALMQLVTSAVQAVGQLVGQVLGQAPAPAVEVSRVPESEPEPEAVEVSRREVVGHTTESEPDAEVSDVSEGLVVDDGGEPSNTDGPEIETETEDVLDIEDEPAEDGTVEDGAAGDGLDQGEDDRADAESAAPESEPTDSTSADSTPAETDTAPETKESERADTL